MDWLDSALYNSGTSKIYILFGLIYVSCDWNFHEIRAECVIEEELCEVDEAKGEVWLGAGTIMAV